MIQVENVSKSYGSRQVLQPTTLHVESGRTHALVGESGSGKSTLLRLIMGLIRPDSGTIRIDGKPLTPETARRMRHSIGYVIQDGGLFPHLTGGRKRLPSRPPPGLGRAAGRPRASRSWPPWSASRRTASSATPSSLAADSVSVSA